eukprot:jgi/Chlat1/6300/Chrsp44S05784
MDRRNRFTSVNLNASYRPAGSPATSGTRTRVGSGGLQVLGRTSRPAATGSGRPLSAGGRDAPANTSTKLVVPKPVNLPSRKSEHAGNDPTVAIVPTASGHAGWNKAEQEEKATHNQAALSSGSTWARPVSTPPAYSRSQRPLSAEEFPSLGAPSEYAAARQEHVRPPLPLDVPPKKPALTAAELRLSTAAPLIPARQWVDDERDTSADFRVREFDRDRYLGRSESDRLVDRGYERYSSSDRRAFDDRGYHDNRGPSRGPERDREGSYEDRMQRGFFGSRDFGGPVLRAAAYREQSDSMLLRSHSLGHERVDGLLLSKTASDSLLRNITGDRLPSTEVNRKEDAVKERDPVREAYDAELERLTLLMEQERERKAEEKRQVEQARMQARANREALMKMQAEAAAKAAQDSLAPRVLGMDDLRRVPPRAADLVARGLPMQFPQLSTAEALVIGTQPAAAPLSKSDAEAELRISEEKKQREAEKRAQEEADQARIAAAQAKLRALEERIAQRAAEQRRREEVLGTGHMNQVEVHEHQDHDLGTSTVVDTLPNAGTALADQAAVTRSSSPKASTSHYCDMDTLSTTSREDKDSQSSSPTHVQARRTEGSTARHERSRFASRPDSRSNAPSWRSQHVDVLESSSQATATKALTQEPLRSAAHLHATAPSAPAHVEHTVASHVPGLLADMDDVDKHEPVSPQELLSLQGELQAEALAEADGHAEALRPQSAQNSVASAVLSALGQSSMTKAWQTVTQTSSSSSSLEFSGEHNQAASPMSDDHAALVSSSGAATTSSLSSITQGGQAFAGSQARLHAADGPTHEPFAMLPDAQQLFGSPGQLFGQHQPFPAHLFGPQLGGQMQSPSAQTAQLSGHQTAASQHIPMFNFQAPLQPSLQHVFSAENDESEWSLPTSPAPQQTAGAIGDVDASTQAVAIGSKPAASKDGHGRESKRSRGERRGSRDAHGQGPAGDHCADRTLDAVERSSNRGRRKDTRDGTARSERAQPGPPAQLQIQLDVLAGQPSASTEPSPLHSARSDHKARSAAQRGRGRVSSVTADGLDEVSPGPRRGDRRDRRRQEYRPREPLPEWAVATVSSAGTEVASGQGHDGNDPSTSASGQSTQGAQPGEVKSSLGNAAAAQWTSNNVDVQKSSVSSKPAPQDNEAVRQGSVPVDTVREVDKAGPNDRRGRQKADRPATSVPVSRSGVGAIKPSFGSKALRDAQEKEHLPEGLFTPPAEASEGESAVSLPAWGGTRPHVQVVSLTQIQLEEAMKGKDASLRRGSVMTLGGVNTDKPSGTPVGSHLGPIRAPLQGLSRSTELSTEPQVMKQQGMFGLKRPTLELYRPASSGAGGMPGLSSPHDDVIASLPSDADAFGAVASLTSTNNAGGLSSVTQAVEDNITAKLPEDLSFGSSPQLATARGSAHDNHGSLPEQVFATSSMHMAGAMFSQPFPPRPFPSPGWPQAPPPGSAFYGGLPSQGLQGLQGSMLVFNHAFGPVNHQYTNFMTPPYMPTGKQPDWKHVPAAHGPMSGVGQGSAGPMLQPQGTSLLNASSIQDRAMSPPFQARGGMQPQHWTPSPGPPAAAAPPSPDQFISMPSAATLSNLGNAALAPNLPDNLGVGDGPSDSPVYTQQPQSSRPGGRTMRGRGARVMRGQQRPISGPMNGQATMDRTGGQLATQSSQDKPAGDSSNSRGGHQGGSNQTYRRVSRGSSPASSRDSNNGSGEKAAMRIKQVYVAKGAASVPVAN